MAEADVLQEQRTPRGESGPVSTGGSTAAPVLARLNARGFRLVMVADTLALVTIMVGTMVWRFGWDWPTFSMTLYAFSFALGTVIFLATFYFGGLYDREPRLGAPPVLPRAAGQALAAGGFVALLRLIVAGFAAEADFIGARSLPFPIRNLVALIVLGALAVAANRQLAYWLRTRREGPPRVVLAGEEDAIETAEGTLRRDPSTAVIVGRASDPADLQTVVRDRSATDVLLLSGSWLDHVYPHGIESLERSGVTVLLRVTARETVLGLNRLREVGGLPYVLLRSQTVPRSRARFKRLFDLSVLAVTAPLWLLALALIALYQLAVVGRPILYRQTRVGAGGALFSLVKFRTMVEDAEGSTGARLADVADERVVRGCGWVRASRMDELPQLWNVLRGEMSLAGPRPERPELTARFEQLIPGYTRRYELPPGLTGLAQIYGRYHTDPEYKLGYDLQYLVNWSPVLDLEIMAKTIWVVLARKL
jgi:lipopolysaccharide/colanic/teichoic acid biosynthesis glycosyltransferase